MSAYGAGKAGDTDFRRTWDRSEYAEKAKAREERDRLKEKNEDRKRRGLPAIKPKKDEGLDQPKELMKMRENRLSLDSNLGKIQVVQGGASGEASRQPGFYCKACDIVVKDSVNYLDHINGRKHQQNVGVQLKVERASVSSVKDRLAMLKRKKEAPEEEEYDLDSRVASLKQQEEEEKRQRKERKRQKKEAKKKKHSKEHEGEGEGEEEDEMAKMMGFSGFGTSKTE
ncbi:hypothetical protein BDA99DRAFT_519600 [Phascolomyces articulosus]|uniref:U1-type domain-containing protein n=1 Tax=Phascolomyces articulosus TaxID=60185 RepID=A0AAD5K3C2_9FUNG|nr:hypothetical protein BDA99DRAFT_519600 [Phascolomyces articulosus]